MFRICMGLISLAYILALVIGILALVSQYWVTGKSEEVRNATVVKEIDCGLFTNHTRYYLKDDNGQDVSKTFTDPEVAITVTGLMLTGLSLLAGTLLLHLVCYFNCCCQGDKLSGKISATVSVLTFVSGGCILACPFIYKNHVVVDLDHWEINVGEGWWLAIASAAMSFIIGLGTAIRCYCLLREKKE